MLSALALLVSASMTAYVCASLYTHLGVLATAGIGAVLEGGKIVIMAMGRIPLWMRLLGVFLVFTSATASVAGLELAGAKQSTVEAERYTHETSEYARQAAQYQTATQNRQLVADGLASDSLRLADMSKLAQDLRAANQPSRAAAIMRDIETLRRDMDKRAAVLRELPQPPELPAKPIPPQQTTPMWRVVAYAIVALLIEAMALVGFWVARRGRPTNEFQRVRDAVISGDCEPTSRGVRKFLKCSQARSLEHARALQRAGLAKHQARSPRRSRAATSSSSSTRASTDNVTLISAPSHEIDNSARVQRA